MNRRPRLTTFGIYNKTFRRDHLRTRNMLTSLREFNSESIPVFISHPRADGEFFDDMCAQFEVTRVYDEDIYRSNPHHKIDVLPKLSGNLSQQIIKSEFWRLRLCEEYLCVDSDMVFTRPFGMADLRASNGDLYTVLHEGKDLLNAAASRGLNKIVRNFHADSERIKKWFGRSGPDYDFGPSPFLWSAKVWNCLDKDYLRPRGLTLTDVIREYGSEVRWYGETLLASEVIPLHPIGPLATSYHYEWQYTEEQHGKFHFSGAETHIGKVLQSNWDKSLEPSFSKKPFVSRLWRQLKESLRGC